MSITWTFAAHAALLGLARLAPRATEPVHGAPTEVVLDRATIIEMWAHADPPDTELTRAKEITPAVALVRGSTVPPPRSTAAIGAARHASVSPVDAGTATDVVPAPAARGYGDPSLDDYGDGDGEGGDASGEAPRLALAELVTGGNGPAAPTTTPRDRRSTSRDVERAVDGARRSDDSKLGFGNREEGIVSAAVREVFRSAVVRSGARAELVVDIDADGTILAAAVVSSTQGDAGMWAGMAANVKARLGGKVELGPTAQRAGVRLVIHATVLHVLSNGTDGTPIVGECPKMPDILLDLHPTPFGMPGGAAWGEFANGTCNLQDIQDPKHKHIEVRTSTTAILPDAGPPPFATLDAAKPKPQRITLGDLFFKGGNKKK